MGLQRVVREPQRAGRDLPKARGDDRRHRLDRRVLVNRLQQVPVQVQVRQPQRRQGQQPQRPVRALLGRAEGIGRAVGDCPLMDDRSSVSSMAAAIATARFTLMFICAPRSSSLTDQVPGPRCAGPTAQPARALSAPADPAEPGAPPCPANLRHALTNLEAVYRQLARPWPADELAQRYEAACDRGARDLPVGEDLPERPIMLLATAIPRLISLAVAANVLHLLPTGTHDAAVLAGELIATIDATATGSLHRCHLASDPTANPAATTPTSGCRSPTSRPPTG